MSLQRMRETPKPAAEGEVFGPYVVYERLGIGGMATVHRALEQGIAGFQREVALKRLLPALAEDESFVASFVREAKLASLLSHANIVKIFELGRVGSSYFISMEYIPGSDVRKILKQARRAAGPPPLTVVVSLLSELCDALDYAHNRADEQGQPLGLVHRDISPSNLLVSSAGHLKIIDFGIAKATAGQIRTQSGRIKGKLAYMAPEALAGAGFDARSDLFSAGVIAHELLTATPLFGSKSDYKVIQRIQKAEVAPPGKFNPRVPEELDALVLKALAKDPKERWQTAAEMRAALEELALRYELHATDREVVEWAEWAFALEPERTATGERDRERDTASSSSDHETGSPSYDPAPAHGPVQSFLEEGGGEATDPEAAFKPELPEVTATGEVFEATDPDQPMPGRAETETTATGGAPVAETPGETLREEEAAADDYGEPPTVYEPREEQPEPPGQQPEPSYDEVPTTYQPRRRGAPREDAPPQERATSRQSVPPIPTAHGPSFPYLVSFRKATAPEMDEEDVVTNPASDEEQGRGSVEELRAQPKPKGTGRRILELGAVGVLLAAAAFSAALYLRSRSAGEESDPGSAAPEPARITGEAPDAGPEGAPPSSEGP